jgi:hypothetical protein
LAFAAYIFILNLDIGCGLNLYGIKKQAQSEIILSKKITRNKAVLKYKK